MRENIFKAHRSHLYQRLVFAGREHRTVTIVYGALAVVGSALACWVISSGRFAAVTSVSVIALLFLGL
jgi:hypothetical protein